MKTLLSFLILFITGFNAVANTSFPKESVGPKVNITLEIGQPLTCFISWGICKIGIGIDILGIAGTLEDGPGGGGGGGSWILSISKQEFAKKYPQFLSKLEGQSMVSFPDTVLFPENVKLAMSSPKDILLQGNSTYPVREKDGFFVIQFPK